MGICLSIVQADILVVISNQSSLTYLTKQNIKRIFLNKTDFLPNGKKVNVAEGMSSKVKRIFYRHITNKSQSQLRSYWAKQVFTGKGRPPHRLNTDKLVNYVVNNPNTISYITQDKMSDALKVLYTIKQ